MRSPAAPSSSAGTTWCTSPIRWASRASKRSPVRKRSRAAPRPDRPQDEGRDDRRQDPEPDLGEREDGALGRDRDVGGGDEAHASADRGPVRERDHRLGAGVDRAQHPRHPLGVRLVLGLRVAAGLAHPVHVGARRRTWVLRPRARRRGWRSRSPASAKARVSSSMRTSSKALRTSGRASVTRRTAPSSREAEVPVRAPPLTIRPSGCPERSSGTATSPPFRRRTSLPFSRTATSPPATSGLAGGGEQRGVIDRDGQAERVLALAPQDQAARRAFARPARPPRGGRTSSRRSSRRSRAG